MEKQLDEWSEIMHDGLMKMFFASLEGIKQEVENNRICSAEYVLYKQTLYSTFKYLEDKSSMGWVSREVKKDE